MLNVTQFRDNVVKPALSTLALGNADMNSPQAEELLMGTAVQESSLIYLRQLSGGPGLGVFQIEPSTHDDVWTNYLAFRPELAAVVNTLAAGGKGTSAQLPWNMGYSAAIARLIYWRAPATMPSASGGTQALAAFWKQYYNTGSGAGTAAQWVNNYNTYVVPAG